MRIKDWLPGFVGRHVGRHPRDDWPDRGRIVAEWFQEFMRVEPKPREAEADAASLRLVGFRLAHLEDHPAALVNLIAEARAGPKPQAAPIPPDREGAAAASRACPRCSGAGLATIYHPRYDGSPTIDVEGLAGEIRIIVSRLAAYCDCPLGRWMHARPPDDGPRIPCLEKTMATTAWTAQDPTVEVDEWADIRPSQWRELAAGLGGAVVHVGPDGEVVT